MYDEKCTKCKGSGLMKTDMIICEACEGRKCSKCLNESGLIRYPLSECDLCFGLGVTKKNWDIRSYLVNKIKLLFK